MTIKTAIAYIRVSTKKQGKSGLGLDAQTLQIETFCKREGISIIQTLIEVESGKNDERPILEQALILAQKHDCPVIVSKLCRLSRSVHFISGLMARGVPFLVAELGIETPSFLLHIYAAVNEQERKVISERTKAALQAWKIRNPEKNLGNPQWQESLPQARIMGHQANRRKGEKTFWSVLPHIQQAARSGCKGTTSFVSFLNERGIRTARGNEWKPGSLHRFIKRAEKESLIAL